MEYALTLNNIFVSDVNKVGYRAVDLAALSRKHFKLPLSFVVNTQALEEFVTVNGIMQKAGQMLSSGNYAGLQQEIMNGQMPEKILLEIREIYDTLNVDKSSNASEIVGAEGQPLVNVIVSPNYAIDGYEGVYQGIKGMNELLQSIKKAWASLFSAKAFQDREALGMREFFSGIIIQQTPRSVASGISASQGENVQVQTYLGYPDFGHGFVKDNFTISKEFLKIENHQVNKQLYYLTHDEEGLLEKIPLEGRGDPQKLDDKMVMELGRLGKKSSAELEADVTGIYTVQGDEILLLFVDRKGNLSAEPAAAPVVETPGALPPAPAAPVPVPEPEPEPEPVPEPEPEVAETPTIPGLPAPPGEDESDAMVDHVEAQPAEMGGLDIPTPDEESVHEVEEMPEDERIDAEQELDFEKALEETETNIDMPEPTPVEEAAEEVEDDEADDDEVVEEDVEDAEDAVEADETEEADDDVEDDAEEVDDDADDDTEYEDDDAEDDADVEDDVEDDAEESDDETEEADDDVEEDADEADDDDVEEDADEADDDDVEYEDDDAEETEDVEEAAEEVEDDEAADDDEAVEEDVEDAEDAVEADDEVEETEDAEEEPEIAEPWKESVSELDGRIEHISALQEKIQELHTLIEEGDEDQVRRKLNELDDAILHLRQQSRQS